MNPFTKKIIIVPFTILILLISCQLWASSSVPIDVKEFRLKNGMLFLVVECERTSAGFTAHGQRGKPAETVAEEACRQLLEWWGSNAALDRHLADQLVLPTALADGESTFTTCCVTRHLLTNIWVVERFGLAYFEVEGDLGAPGKITVKRTNSGAQKIPRPRCL